MNPISDQYMTYDAKTKHYVLTEKDVSDNLGISLESELKTSVNNVLASFLKQISSHCYTWIHQFNRDTKYQDFILATTEEGRDIIKRAMEQQLIYVLMNGDMSRSLDKEERAMWFDKTAEEILNEEIKEIGTSVCYTGTFRLFDKGGFIEWLRS